MKKPEEIEEAKVEETPEESGQYYDYLVDYFENPQLLDMTANDDQSTDYIVDLDHKGNDIVITYLDGHQHIEKGYTEHNMNVWRRRIIRQIEEHYDVYQEGGGKALLKILRSEIGSILTPVAGLIIINIVSKIFLQYNIDIHIAIKIIIEAILIVKAIIDSFYNHYLTSRIIKMLMESNKYKKYADIAQDLEYYNKETRDYCFALPVEDTWKKRIPEEKLEEIRTTVLNLKKECGDKLIDFTLTYKPNNKSNV